MHIKSLKLINFQKHSDLQIDFVNGVNILYGTSDAGKSCIRRALEWITQNESIDGIRKTGTKKTIVTLTLDNDIEIERVRSVSINRYIIREGKKEQVFDAIGKTIPDEIKEKLTIYPIEVDGEEIYLNSQPQIALPFLFDKSPSFRMKLFNKLTGNDVLDKLFGQFNKDILRIKRDLREETERFEDRATLLKRKKIEKEKAEAIHIRLKSRLGNLKKLYDNYAKLLEIEGLEEANLCNLQEVKVKLNNLKIPKDVDIKRLRENIARFEKLKTAKNASEKIQAGLEKVRGQLSVLKPLSIDIESLKSKIERFDTLKALREHRVISYKAYSELKQDLHDTELVLCHNIKKYKDLLKDKVCPICQTECDEEHIRRIKL